MVNGPAGGRHHDIHAPAESLELLVDGLAAVDRDHAQPERPAIALECLSHLHGEFPGRDDDERGRRAAGRSSRHERGEDRERERGGLAGAGGRLGEDIAAREEEGDCLPLDRGRLLVAEVGKGLEEWLADAQRRKPVCSGRLRARLRGLRLCVGAFESRAQRSNPVRVDCVGGDGVLRGLGRCGLEIGRGWFDWLLLRHRRQCDAIRP